MPTKEEIKNKLTHGVPNLTDAECLWLWQQAFPGEAIERRKRCRNCDGEGSVWVDKMFGDFVECDACGGSGYIRNEHTRPPNEFVIDIDNLPRAKPSIVILCPQRDDELAPTGDGATRRLKNCRRCGGGRILYHWHETAYGASYIEVECDHCGGTGKEPSPEK